MSFGRNCNEEQWEESQDTCEVGLSQRERERRRRSRGKTILRPVISGQAGDGWKLSSHPSLLHPSALLSIHLTIHHPIHPFISKGVSRGDKTRLNGNVYADACVCVSHPCAWASARVWSCLWNLRHEGLKQNRQKDENAPVSQPQPPLLGPGDPLYDPVTGRLRDLLQHSGRLKPRASHLPVHLVVFDNCECHVDAVDQFYAGMEN